MTLLGSITKLQNLGKAFYEDLEDVFAENSLIRETWASMSQDLAQQTAGLQNLPHSFWNRLKDEESTALREAVQSCWHPDRIEKETNGMLLHSLSRMLDFEEPLILGVYVPLIRRLRSEGSGQNLDLYIMVKSHVYRLQQVTRSFSGDPVSVQRVDSLILTFEKEVQVPEEVVVHHPKPAVRAARKRAAKPVARKPARVRKPAARKPVMARKPAARRPVEKRKKLLPKRSKPLLKVSRRARV